MGFQHPAKGERLGHNGYDVRRAQPCRAPVYVDRARRSGLEFMLTSDGLVLALLTSLEGEITGWGWL